MLRSLALYHITTSIESVRCLWKWKLSEAFVILLHIFVKMVVYWTQHILLYLEDRPRFKLKFFTPNAFQRNWSSLLIYFYCFYFFPRTNNNVHTTVYHKSYFYILKHIFKSKWFLKNPTQFTLVQIWIRLWIRI